MNDLIKRVYDWDESCYLSKLGGDIPENEKYEKPTLGLDHLGPQDIIILQDGKSYTLTLALSRFYYWEDTSVNGEKVSDNDLFRLPFEYLICPVASNTLSIKDNRIEKTEDNIALLINIVSAAYNETWTDFINDPKNLEMAKLLSSWLPEHKFPELTELLINKRNEYYQQL